MGDALREAFLKIDANMLSESGVAELKSMSNLRELRGRGKKKNTHTHTKKERNENNSMTTP